MCTNSNVILFRKRVSICTHVDLDAVATWTIMHRKHNDMYAMQNTCGVGVFIQCHAMQHGHVFVYWTMGTHTHIHMYIFICIDVTTQSKGSNDGRSAWFLSLCYVFIVLRLGSISTVFVNDDCV